MPRIYKGEPWEAKYRREVRNITKGLTASKNGRGPIKVTQLIWDTGWEKDPNKDTPISYMAWSKDLPWLKKSLKRNLQIIKKSVQEMKGNPNLNFKEVIKKNAIEYDLKNLEASSKAVLTKTNSGITYSENLEANDEFLIEKLPSSHEINIKLSNEEYKTLEIIKKELELKESEVIKKLISQYVSKPEIINKELELKDEELIKKLDSLYAKKTQINQTEIFTKELNSKEAKELKELLSNYAKKKLLKDKIPEIKFQFREEENTSINDISYLQEEVWESLRNKDEEFSQEDFIKNMSSLFNPKTLKMMYKLLEKDSENSAKLLFIEKFIAFERSKVKFKKEFQSELDLTIKIFKDRMKNFDDNDLRTLFASMKDAFKKEQIKTEEYKASS